VIIVLLAGLVFVSRQWRSNERIMRIQIHGLHLVQEKEIIDSMQNLIGSRLADVDLRDVRNRALHDPCIRAAVVTRTVNALDIVITERIPVARVEFNGKMNFMDSTGTLFPAGAGTLIDVPVVYGITKNARDEKISESINNQTIDTAALRDILSLVHAAQSSGAGVMDAVSVIRRMPAGEIDLETNGCAVPVRIGAPAELAEKIAMLRNFLPVLLQRGEQNAQYVDMRFHDQVVVSWKDSLDLN